MSLLKIARFGHPVLLLHAAPVADPTAPEIRRLVHDMGETMLDAQGLGLAAPQVHASWRLFVWRQGRDGVAALINPEVTLLDPAEEVAFEGCLSIPGLRGAVRRSPRVGYRGFALDGRAVEGEADGLLARVMQHEVDHLDGVLYPMRMHDLSLLGFTEELAQHAPRPAETEPTP